MGGLPQNEYPAQKRKKPVVKERSDVIRQFEFNGEP